MNVIIVGYIVGYLFVLFKEQVYISLVAINDVILVVAAKLSSRIIRKQRARRSTYIIDIIFPTPGSHVLVV